MLVRRLSRPLSRSSRGAPDQPSGSPWRRATGAAAALLLTALAVQLPQQSPAVADDSAPATQSLCGIPQPGHFTCFAVRKTDSGVRGARSAAPEGYGPADLRSAYDLPDGGGAGTTVAVVDAYDDPDAEADLAVYRAQYGLPACTTANGCFTKVDQRGGTDYPRPTPAGPARSPWTWTWSRPSPEGAHPPRRGRRNSTARPRCRGRTPRWRSAPATCPTPTAPTGTTDPAELGRRRGVLQPPRYRDRRQLRRRRLRGSYPAASPYVTSVGGTSLIRDTSTARLVGDGVEHSTAGPARLLRSTSPSRPSRPTPVVTGARSRTSSAVADPATGVAVYNSYSGGTAGRLRRHQRRVPDHRRVYALTRDPGRRHLPDVVPVPSPGALNDVTTATTQLPERPCGPAPRRCSPLQCIAGPGYDGPTGLGTPKGVGAFRPGPHGTRRRHGHRRATGSRSPAPRYASARPRRHRRRRPYRSRPRRLVPADGHRLRLRRPGPRRGRPSPRCR